ncbi:O-antigen ligase family protein [Thermoflexus sp.]|uniref:O-antigen ligase family protein n=1 Tax=Thermoflexus sp. TaxID=1969742 RepID=UPI0025F39CC4|nr:O-antigen ligase family protein [Thermoflexus sp.]MDW8064911.1 O-antigen ligase family protein [Anaerolineae bacterium]MCS6964937.1 O-antigen ligase family protein [Thermoflexus sp.]MCS7351872.1 O-antigen ligase family protein [Thermoflexus sp.]MCX7690109.1 O-antigen ligase family protein [Thermoflexus sp.]MDW8181331.1 O-antigen ligase family protein [Anaerolineae bacterium]
MERWIQGLGFRGRSFAYELGWGLIALGAGGLLVARPELLLVGLAGLGLIFLLRAPEIALSAALITGPLTPLENELFRPPLPSAQIFLGLALFAWLWRGLAQRDLRLPRWGWGGAYALFLGYALVSLLWAPSWEEGIPEWIKWAQIGLVAILVLTAPPGLPRLLLGAALLSGALQAGIGIWQAFLRGTGPEHFRLPGLPFYRAYGTFQQPNPFAGMMGLIAPVALGLAFGWLRHPQRSVREGMLGLGSLAIGGLALLALIVSWSRGAWLGAAVAMGTLILMLPARSRWGIAALTALVLSGALLWAAGWIPAPVQARLAGAAEELRIADVRGVEVNEANFAIIERLAHWQAAVGMIRDHPWQGVGFGNYAAAYPAYALIRWPNPLGHAHNVYLNVAAETGLIGLLLYLWLWFAIGVQTWQAWRRNTGWRRGLAAGVMAAWAHLHVHQFFDNLYVANLPLLIALYGAWVELLNQEAVKSG